MRRNHQRYKSLSLQVRANTWKVASHPRVAARYINYHIRVQSVSAHYQVLDGGNLMINPPDYDRGQTAAQQN